MAGQELRERKSKFASIENSLVVLSKRVQNRVFEEGHSDLASRVFGAGHHAAEGTGAGGGGLLAGLTGEEGGLVDIGD